MTPNAKRVERRELNWFVPHPFPLPEGEGIACGLLCVFVSRGLRRQIRERTIGRERTQSGTRVFSESGKRGSEAGGKMEIGK
jgi:hypothetical protein